MLRIWIRDPVFFDPWIHNRKKPDMLESISRIIISKSLVTILTKNTRYQNSLLRRRNREPSDPGSGMEKFGSGIHIPDPQHSPDQCLTLKTQCRDPIPFWPGIRGGKIGIRDVYPGSATLLQLILKLKTQCRDSITMKRLNFMKNDLNSNEALT